MMWGLLEAIPYVMSRLYGFSTGQQGLAFLGLFAGSASSLSQPLSNDLSMPAQPFLVRSRIFIKSVSTSASVRRSL